jgi:polysaccharide deacetylase 2 family uncharacterized protein YibQ
VIKVRGKKNPKPFIIFTLVLIAATLILSRSLTRHERKVATRALDEGQRVEEPVMRPAERTEPSERVYMAPDARIAIIVDDVGYSNDLIERFLQFQGKLTFSILPFQSESVHAAQTLHRGGFEIMIHIPMEPLDYPETDPGEGALLLTDDRGEVLRKLDRMIRSTPHARGANNHMGSAATQDTVVMTWVLSYLQREGLYFVDSLTTSQSRAYELAVRMELPTMKRDVFLDNESDVSYIREQFEELKRTALERGYAVGIGHAHSENLLRVLDEQLPRLREQGIALVYASELASN